MVSVLLYRKFVDFATNSLGRLHTGMNYFKSVETMTEFVKIKSLLRTFSTFSTQKSKPSPTRKLATKPNVVNLNKYKKFGLLLFTFVVSVYIYICIIDKIITTLL